MYSSLRSCSSRIILILVQADTLCVQPKRFNLSTPLAREKLISTPTGFACGLNHKTVHVDCFFCMYTLRSGTIYSNINLQYFNGGFYEKHSEQMDKGRHPCSFTPLQYRNSLLLVNFQSGNRKLYRLFKRRR